MLGDALDFPTRGDDGSTALLIGGAVLLVAAVFQLIGSILLPLLAVTLVCRIAVRGYYVRVLRRAAVDPGAEAPAFDDWGDLLGDGLYALVVFLVYLVPLVVLLGLAIGGSGFGGPVEDPSAAVDVVRNAAGLALMLALLYFLAMSYVVPAAVTNFAHEGEFQAAFRLRTVLDGALSEDYAVGWLLTVVLQLFALPVAFLLQFLVVGFFVSFFVGVAVRYVLGRSFGAAMEFQPDGTPAGEPSAVGTMPATDATPRSGVPGGEEPIGWAGGEAPAATESDDEGGTGSADDATATDRARTPAEKGDLFDVGTLEGEDVEVDEDNEDDPLAGEFDR